MENHKDICGNIHKIRKQTMNKEIGIKESKGKIRWSLIDFKSLEPMARVLNFGAVTKYEPGNWKNVPNKAPYLDACMRHLLAYLRGEEKDQETGESHLASLMCNAMFLIHDRDSKKDVPFDEYLKQLTTYDDYVKDLDIHKFD